MELDDAPDVDSLDRLRDLVDGLGGSLGSGDLLGWVATGDISALPGEVYDVLGNAGLLGAGNSDLSFSVPGDAAALMSLMWEVDEPAAIELLMNLVAAGRPKRLRHQDPRRFLPAPEDIFDEIAGLIGPAARWWTNTDLTNWNPVTTHAFDAVVVGAGNDIILTLVAFEGGG